MKIKITRKVNVIKCNLKTFSEGTLGLKFTLRHFQSNVVSPASVIQDCAKEVTYESGASRLGTAIMVAVCVVALLL